MSHRRLGQLVGIFTLVTLAAFPASEASAQYFGRNKVQYRSFDFKVLRTEHFDVYYYEAEQEAAEQAGRMAERWYERLSRVLDHQLNGRQPLILYASHPDFEQTNAISGELGEGTGGVTELLKRRIVLPLAGPLGETDHVIGHELVHAFQFDITRHGGTGTGFVEAGAARLPLWFVEGMAEYLSIGPVDPHTAMWMRDAAQSNKIPSIRKLNDPRYFPYRYGEALWAYIAGRWGDHAVGEILKATGRQAEAEQAIRKVTGLPPDSLTRDWHRAIRDWYKPIASTAEPPTRFGRALVTGKSGRNSLNLAPALSPDGRLLLFYSERDLFSIELYLADAGTGRILRKVTRTAVDPHYQSLQFINSAGAWSADGRRIALAAVSAGKPVLSVIDARSGRLEHEFTLPEIGEIFNPTWSPDGKRIAFAAIAGGLTDLFEIELQSGTVRRLTDDQYADLEPAWSPDGSSIAFVTDRFSTGLDSLTFGNERLALLDVATGAVREVASFHDGKNINPQWSPDGKSLFFVSDHGGVSNVYRVSLAGGEITQVTDVRTGVSGITRLSPAISVSRDAGRLAFSVYEGGNYDLFTTDSTATLAGRSLAAAGNRAAAATLPPPERSGDELEKLHRDPALGLASPGSFKRAPYHPGLSLDYVAQPGIGVAAGTNGVAVGGGTTLYWSDMLGNHNLATLIQASNAGGSVANNLTAVVAYQNLKSRWNWGVAGAQIPYVSRDFETDEGTYNERPAVREQDFRFWQIDRDIEGTLAYPFSRVQRVEFSAGYRNIAFVSEVESRIFDEITGDLLVDETTAHDTIPSLSLATASAALVYDSSVFGGTDPVLGQRYRLEIDPVGGNLNYVGALADYRRYVTLRRPLTLAGRVLHFGRYGRSAEDVRLTDLYLGDPWLIHGYDSESFSSDEVPTLDRLLGSRLAVGNLELRLPLLGGLGVISSPGFPPVELAGFLDGGVAWRAGDLATFLGGHREAVTSYGSALRVNVFGIAVAEWAFVHPNDRPGKGWYWQFSLQPGF